MQSAINHKKFLRYLLLFIAIALGTWLFRSKKPATTETVRDFTAIKTSGVLHAAVEYNKLSMYVEKDTLTGFNYEILKAFARDMKLKLEVKPVANGTEAFDGLRQGKFDILACNLPATVDMKDSLLLSYPIMLNKQVLVQRKPGKGKATYIKSQLDLAKKTLNVPEHSAAILRIHNMGNEIGDTIYIKEVKRYGNEQLMYMVEHGDIDYAVCDENIAKEYAPLLKNIDIKMAISFTQFYSWGMDKHQPMLLKQLNQWLKHFKNTEEYKRICQKYTQYTK